jgi:ketosteroid isomerase-like protein
MLKTQPKNQLLLAYNAAMKPYWMVFLFVPLLATPGQDQKPLSASQTQAETGTATRAQTQPEEDIRRVLLAQVESWNRGDLEAFMNGYWHSPYLIFFSGTTITKGWEPTLQRYQQRYKGEGKEMGQLEFLDLNIDLLGRNAAVATGKWQLTMSDGKKPGGLFTLIIKRLPGGWRIVHDHTSGG